MADALRQRRTRLERFYREEVESFRATDRLSRDTASALKTVCHALFWACALMEFHKKNTAGYVAFRDPDPAAGVIAGVRYGRNRAIHQFPQLLQITEGAQFPIKLPAPSSRYRGDYVATFRLRIPVTTISLMSMRGTCKVGRCA
jgi:hypothetical protein